MLLLPTAHLWATLMFSRQDCCGSCFASFKDFAAYEIIVNIFVEYALRFVTLLQHCRQCIHDRSPGNVHEFHSAWRVVTVRLMLNNLRRLNVVKIPLQSEMSVETGHISCSSWLHSYKACQNLEKFSLVIFLCQFVFK